MFNLDFERGRVDGLQAHKPLSGHCRVSTVNFDTHGPNAYGAEETEHLNDNVSHIQSTDWGAPAQFDYHEALRRRDETREVITARIGGNNGYRMQGGHR